MRHVPYHWTRAGNQSNAKFPKGSSRSAKSMSALFALHLVFWTLKFLQPSTLSTSYVSRKRGSLLSKPSSSINIPGYQSPIRKDRAETSGGGVAIYVRSGLAVKIIHPPKLINIETTCIQIILGKKARLNVIVVYHPHGPAGENFVTQLNMLIDHLQGCKQTPLCAVGDFNAKVSDWLPEQTTDKVGLLLKQLALSQELTQVVREATFGVNTASPSLLDLIFINKPQLLKSCSTLPQIADHCPTTVKLSLCGPAPPKPQVFFTWDLENADFKSMKATL